MVLVDCHTHLELYFEQVLVEVHVLYWAIVHLGLGSVEVKKHSKTDGMRLLVYVEL